MNVDTISCGKIPFLKSFVQFLLKGGWEGTGRGLEGVSVLDGYQFCKVCSIKNVSITLFCFKETEVMVYGVNKI